MGCVRFVSASCWWLVVLTIGKLGASRSQVLYYESRVAAGIEDYYAGRGEVAGVWRGAGVEALGLEVGRPVDRSGFLALMRGRGPVDRSVLRSMGAASTVAALDLTFSAPKSVSVLFAVADDDSSVALRDAHEWAVDQALSYLEREACFTRRGHAGSERVRGDGFVAAAYRHRMSRAGDPQLHTHVVVANLTRADGRYTALDAHALYEHKSAAGAVYRAVLRAQVCERLPALRWRATGRGLFEIDGVPDRLLRHFSQRRVEIEQRAAELVGAALGDLSRERMQGIALATRPPKDYGVEVSCWRDLARARAAEHGFGQAELDALTSRGGLTPVQPDLAALTERLSGAGGLTARHNTFVRRHALAEIAGAFGDGATLARLEQATDRYLAHASIRALSARHGTEARFTTEGLLTCERAILDGAQRRRSQRVGLVPVGRVDRVLVGHQPVVNDDQAAAVRAITKSGNGVDTVAALAGTGKTTMIAALAACYQQAGWRVIGTAPTGRAARELRDAAEIPAGTMHSLAGELREARRFPARTILVIDEAGMAPTRLSAKLLACAERDHVKVIAVGDPGQLGSVHAGGWLAALTRAQPGPTLHEVIRQHDPVERRALEALHDGQPDRYLAHKQDQIAVHDSEAAAIGALTDQWHHAQRQHGPAGAVMITRDNQTRQQLNQAARQRLKRTGVLPEHGEQIALTEYAPGDRVIARRNDRDRDIDNGTLGTITRVDTRAQHMLVRTDSGQLRALDYDYVISHLQHAYALTAHGAQGATVDWAGVIGRPEEFTRQWAYTALSRARAQTTLHVIAEPTAATSDRAQYAPTEPKRDLKKTLTRSSTQ